MPGISVLVSGRLRCTAFENKNLKQTARKDNKNLHRNAPDLSQMRLSYLAIVYQERNLEGGCLPGHQANQHVLGA
jgi:hypothetical protein